MSESEINPQPRLGPAGMLHTAKSFEILLPSLLHVLESSHPRLGGRGLPLPGQCTHRVWTDCSGAKSPLLIVCSLLSYRESRLRFCRSWKVFTRRQLILLALRRLQAEERPLVIASGARAGCTCRDCWKVAIPHPRGLAFLPQPREREATSGGFPDPPHFAPITMDAVLHIRPPHLPLALSCSLGEKLGVEPSTAFFFSALEFSTSRNQKG